MITDSIDTALSQFAIVDEDDNVRRGNLDRKEAVELAQTMADRDGVTFAIYPMEAIIHDECDGVIPAYIYPQS